MVYQRFSLVTHIPSQRPHPIFQWSNDPTVVTTTTWSGKRFTLWSNARLKGHEINGSLEVLKLPQKLPSGNTLQFANWKISIFQVLNGSFSYKWVMLEKQTVSHYQRLLRILNIQELWAIFLYHWVGVHQILTGNHVFASGGKTAPAF